MTQNKWHRRDFLLFSMATAGAAVLAGCGGGSADQNAYAQRNLAASSVTYQALFTFPEMINAWGIAIRPKGAGGHFWVTGGGRSWQFLGDVTASATPALRTLQQDGLKEVTIPGADSLLDDASLGKATGTAHNGADLNAPVFRVSGQTAVVNGQTIALAGSARFVFVTDSGRVTAWTERAVDGTIVRVDGPSQEMFDGSAQGMAFFGAAFKPGSWDRLWLADFGVEPQIRTLDANWQLIDTIGFANPFATGAAVDAADPGRGRKPVPGDPVPFNIQAVGTRIFVTYAVSRADEADPRQFFAAEEDALDAASEAATGFRPGKGKLVEYDVNGNLLRIFKDDDRLNAPWGVAVAPDGFGPLSNAVLVGNFGGNGTIAAFSDSSGKFIDFMKTPDGTNVAIPGLWGLIFGNGESLGDSAALYFAAGPKDEQEGLFGSLRYAD